MFPQRPTFTWAPQRSLDGVAHIHIRDNTRMVVCSNSIFDDMVMLAGRGDPNEGLRNLSSVFVDDLPSTPQQYHQYAKALLGDHLIGLWSTTSIIHRPDGKLVMWTLQSTETPPQRMGALEKPREEPRQAASACLDVNARLAATDQLLWLKYGNKSLLGQEHLKRAYYKCGDNPDCKAKLKIDRSRETGEVVKVMPAGFHNHHLNLLKETSTTFGTNKTHGFDPLAPSES
eukprot:TRINITY_DN497_c0_g3_i1.p1 TRINITY_DN497_c0_g3~~TRINITY_DN497_c0_g3_i1.p1  ORF type:complete len:230 (-),score=42.88 TRINITY_DN497_c0_g3_i1:62-751(-)